MTDICIFDGAYGTYIDYTKLNLEFPEMANIANRDIVLNVHREYINSGATAIKTNTFGVNPSLISQNDVLENVIKSGFEIACEAALGRDIKIFSDMGPIYEENADDAYVKLAEIFIGAGAKCFLFETLNEASYLHKAIRYIKNNVADSIIITSFAVSQDGYTKSANYYKDLFDEAIALGADYVGLNCVCGPVHMLELIKAIPVGKYPLIVMPNAGYPTNVNGRTVYFDNPEYFSEKLFEIYSYGVRVLGGCCGTTPEHIRLFVNKVKSGKPETIKAGTAVSRVSATKKNPDYDKKTVIAVEISPPIDADAAYIINASNMAKQHGADFITVPDSPLGKARANSFIISGIVQRQCGINTIPHICCRDKNQIAIKGDLLAANIDGIRSVLAITGDAIAKQDRVEASNVFGLNSFKLISFIKSLNETVFAQSPYTICAALNISPSNFDFELRRAEKKIKSGADILLTQPIFSAENAENLFMAKARLNCKIMAGVMPLAGYKNAMFLNNEVAGINIPTEIIKSLENKDADEAKDICLGYAKGIIDGIKGECDGYYIMTPLKRIDLSLEIVDYIRRFN